MPSRLGERFWFGLAVCTAIGIIALGLCAQNMFGGSAWAAMAFQGLPLTAFYLAMFLLHRRRRLRAEARADQYRRTMDAVLREVDVGGLK